MFLVKQAGSDNAQANRISTSSINVVDMLEHENSEDIDEDIESRNTLSRSIQPLAASSSARENETIEIREQLTQSYRARLASSFQEEAPMLDQDKTKLSKVIEEQTSSSISKHKRSQLQYGLLSNSFLTID